MMKKKNLTIDSELILKISNLHVNDFSIINLLLITIYLLKRLVQSVTKFIIGDHKSTFDIDDVVKKSSY